MFFIKNFFKRGDKVARKDSLLIQKIVAEEDGRRLLEKLVYMIHLRAGAKSDLEEQLVSLMTNLLSLLILGRENVSFCVIKQHFFIQHSLLMVEELEAIEEFEKLILKLNKSKK